MWNRLVATSINYREVSKEGGEGTSTKEDNGGREGVILCGGYES